MLAFGAGPTDGAPLATLTGPTAVLYAPFSERTVFIIYFETR
jgi:hypothetical protein